MIPPQKLGLYGGSFDPIHIGHLILARDAMESLGLDRMVFIPAGISPHKLSDPPAPAEIRLAMVRAAIADEPDFACDDCEVRREGPSFAIDTVREFIARNPGCEIHYFIGEDNVDALDTWREIGELRRLAQLRVFPRGDHPDSKAGRRVDISSTEIRNRIASGLSVRYLVPDAVCDIMTSHRLYRND